MRAITGTVWEPAGHSGGPWIFEPLNIHTVHSLFTINFVIVGVPN